MAQDCTDLLDHLGWERAHVLGMSLGGMIAQELALSAPARVVTLCLVVTAARGAGGTSMNAVSLLTANIFDSDLRRNLLRSERQYLAVRLYFLPLTAQPRLRNEHSIFKRCDRRP